MPFDLAKYDIRISGPIKGTKKRSGSTDAMVKTSFKGFTDEELAVQTFSDPAEVITHANDDIDDEEYWARVRKGSVLEEGAIKRIELPPVPRTTYLPGSFLSASGTHMPTRMGEPVRKRIDYSFRDPSLIRMDEMKAGISRLKQVLAGPKPMAKVLDVDLRTMLLCFQGTSLNQEHSEPTLRDLCRYVEVYEYNKDQVICFEGHPNDMFYVIIKGKVTLHRTKRLFRSDLVSKFYSNIDENKGIGRMIAKLKEGDSFGYWALRTRGQLRNHTAVAEEDETQVMALSTEHFMSVTAGTEDKVENMKIFQINFLRSMKLFNGYTLEHIKQIMEVLVEKAYDANQTILGQSENQKTGVYIVQQGEVRVTQRIDMAPKNFNERVISRLNPQKFRGEAKVDIAIIPPGGFFPDAAFGNVNHQATYETGPNNVMLLYLPKNRFSTLSKSTIEQFISESDSKFRFREERIKHGRRLQSDMMCAVRVNKAPEKIHGPDYSKQ